MALAHSEEPCMQKIWEIRGKIRGTPFHKLEHESKMRLLHPHTSERRGYEADKAC